MTALMLGAIDSGATAWVLVSAALVLFMTPGLAFFYGGMVRSKNVLAMLMQNVFAIGIISILWVTIGFSLAFGDGGGLIGDLSMAGLADVWKENFTIPGYVDSFALVVPPLAFVAFQMMFAVITPALITGATADRMKFSAYAVFIALWSLLVYSPVAHWVFSPTGWLFELGALDFAGGAVIHINAGVAGLVLCLIIGKRRNWPREAMPPHSLPLTVLGTGILWFGWFGFNAGSALFAGNLTAQALVNTHVAAAAAMCTWLVVEKVKGGHATTLGGASGAVAGLVAITPCAGFVGTMPAVAIGGIAGVACYLALSLKTRFGFDDALDVIAVHLVGGLVGSLLLGFFADLSVNSLGADGLFNGGGLSLLGKQAIACIAVIVYSGIVTTIIALGIKKTIGLRVTDEEETIGLDQSLHSETAYSFVGR